MKKKYKNTLLLLLHLLGVKYNYSYANKLFNEHPHKYDLLGLSQMLLDYNIPNCVLQLNKKIEIQQIDPPFVAYVNNGFATIIQINNDELHYIFNGESVRLSLIHFLDLWSGIVLILEAKDKSIEPNYCLHRKMQILNNFKVCTLWGIVGIFLLGGYISNDIYRNVEYSLLLFINIIGFYICCFIMMKQHNLSNTYIDKLCLLFHQGDCRRILNHRYGNFFGIFSWGEVGSGYFFSNIVFLLYLPNFVFYITVINILALPYSFWSIWYQKYIARQWCPLCLIIQVLLWTIFLINMYFSQAIPLNISFEVFFTIITAYIFSCLIINQITPFFSLKLDYTKVVQRLNQLRADEGVFSLLLKKEPFYQVDLSNSHIFFGNPNSRNLITIFSNPYCDPCAKVHDKMKRLLAYTNNDLCIQYIFASVDEETEIGCRFLISIYKHITDRRDEIYSLWFENGKSFKEYLLNRYSSYLYAEWVSQEYSKHYLWQKKTQISVTPTILFRGHKLPDNYEVEDIKLILDFDF